MQMRFLVAALVFVMPGAVAADELEFELTPFGAYRMGGEVQVEDTDGEYDLDDAGSYGLIVNFRHRDNTQWEILYSRQDTDARFSDATAGNPDVDVELHVLQLGGTYLGDGDVVRPYLAATIGGTYARTSALGSESDTFLSGSIGVGIRVMPNERFGLRLEARAYGTLVDSDTDIFCRTGPDENICAISASGSALGQIEAFAGLIVRF